jgi:heptosyltransferase-3
MGRPDQLQADRGNPRLKFLDRYVGIPAVAALAVPRRLRGRRRLPDRWQTVGLLVTSGVGDIVVATGVLADLRRARPDADIVLFVTANNASFAELLTAPDEVVELPVRRPWIAVREVRARHCDVIVDLGAWRRFDAALAILGGARATIGLRTPGQHRHYGYDVVVDHERRHEIENDRHLVAALGIESSALPRVERPDRSVPPVTGPYAVFHLWPGGANFEARSWPLDHWQELASALSTRGLAIALTGGPGDVGATQSVVERWRGLGISAYNAAGGTWPESLAWLDHAIGVVSVNTGVMHVAAALGRPTIALNGPTSTTRWRPLGPLTRSVTSPVVPDGYLNLGFERDDRYRDCMDAISVEAVVRAWDDVLAEARRRC